MISTIVKWFAVLILVVRMVYEVSIVGKERAVVTPKDASTQVLVSMTWILLIIFFWET